MKFVVAMNCSEADLEFINDSVKSLLNGLVQPHEIVITLAEGVKIPQSLRKKMSQPDSKVRMVRVDKEYGALSAVLGAMERHPIHTDVYIVLLDGNCTYPPHLLKEYETTIPELEKSLKEKLPNSNGSVYGLNGIVMTKDKNSNLDREFLQLIGKSDEQYEERNIIGYVRENATVDYLESCGSICVHRSLLKNDFQTYLDKIKDVKDGKDGKDGKEGEFAYDVLFSNYFAKHQVLRTQICNLVINRFMLQRAGYLEHHVELLDLQKRELFEKTVRHLRNLNCFYAYA